MTTPDPNLFTLEVANGNPPEYYSVFPDGFDLSYLIPSVFMQIDFWSDLLTSWADVANTNLNQPIEALLHIRDPEVQSTAFKALHSEMMGYEMPASIMTDGAYNRLNRGIGEYLWAQGSDTFIQFLGYVCGIKLTLMRLWTEDYVNFSASPGQNNTVFEGGTWYPTTHVGVIVESNPNATDVVALTDSVLTQKFYEEAPIDLILLWIAEGTTINLGTLYLSMAMISVTVETKFSLSAIMNPNLGLNMVMLQRGSVNNKASLYWPTTSNPIKVGSLSYAVKAETYPVDGLAIIWTNDTPIFTPFSTITSIASRRATQGWTFTGVGSGTWAGPNALRYNCDPKTGLQIGILLEGTATNYVASSMTFTLQQSWVRNGNPQPIEIGFISMDGTRSVQWQPVTDNDSISQTVYLLAGEYTAQIVYRTRGGVPPAGFSPHIYRLSTTPTTQVINGLYAESTFIPDEDFATVDGDGWSPLDFSNVLDLGDDLGEDLGDEWVRLKYTFTLPVNGNIQIVLPIPCPIEYFYVGVEDGSTATSFINTANCAIGVREEDTLVIDTNGLFEGSLALGFKYVGFDGGDSTFTPSETPLTVYNAAGQVIVSMTTTGQTPTDTMTGAVTDYLQGQTYTFKEAVQEFPQMSLSWTKVGGSFALNSNVNNYPNTSMVPAVTRIGPGWHGHLTGLIILPISVNNITLNLMLSATKDPGGLNLGGSFFAGWN